MKLLLENWREFMNESTEWQHSETEKAYEESGYRDFLAGLSVDQRRKLHAEISHHLMTSLTVPMMLAEEEGAKEIIAALEDSQERLKRLLHVLAPLDEDVE
ncbi:MAG: hypothetical protein CMI54_07570 [Parcubacteria group bacterium]|nr:hypothetical protein [Parcubacteria group bacterium]